MPPRAHLADMLIPSPHRLTRLRGFFAVPPSLPFLCLLPTLVHALPLYLVPLRILTHSQHLFPKKRVLMHRAAVVEFLSLSLGSFVLGHFQPCCSTLTISYIHMYRDLGLVFSNTFPDCAYASVSPTTRTRSIKQEICGLR